MLLSVPFSCATMISFLIKPREPCLWFGLTAVLHLTRFLSFLLVFLKEGKTFTQTDLPINDSSNINNQTNFQSNDSNKINNTKAQIYLSQNIKKFDWIGLALLIGFFFFAALIFVYL